MAFKTQEEIEARAPELLARAVSDADADHQVRVSKALKLVTGVIAENPDVRFADGRKLLAIRATEPGRDKPMSGVFFAPPHELNAGFGREGFDERVAAMAVGSQVSMAGTWSKRKWEDRGVPKETWEFQAQFAESGRLSIDQLAARAAARIDAFRPEGAAVADPARDRPGGRPPASPDLSYVTGSIVDDRAQVLVNTVNSQLSEHGNPVMGKGVALAFKERFPTIMREYGAAIRSGELKPGRALLFDLPDGRKWAALATKDNFKDPSQEAWVESGLRELGEKMRAAGLTSVALPPPGCGNGGLDWKRVEPMVHEHLGGGGIRIAMYAKPSGAMEPAIGFGSQRQAPAPQRSQADDAKARTLAAFGGGPATSAGVPREWSKDDILKAIPQLLRADGYSAYAGIGSRETPQDVCDDMTAIAKTLEGRGFTLRSGFAGGADTAFELGTTRDDRREIFAPWKGFGANPNSPHEKTRWDQIRRHEQITGHKFTPARATLLEGAMARKSEQLAAPHHPNWDRLGSDPKALHSRNMGQVLGPNLDVPARFEMAYTVDGKASGGTGQAIRVAQSVGIPVLNLHDADIRAAVMTELGIGRERQVERSSDLDAVRSAPSREARPGEFDLSVPPVRSRAKGDVESFCKVADRNGIMSNMAHTPIKVGDLVYSSSEALYQALRFPGHPELQRRIAAERAYPSKILAHENKHLTRPDWNDVNTAAMAYAVTVKRDQVPAFRAAMEATGDRDIVELSVKDDFWGARPQGDRLVGHDMLGSILTQSRDGARMDEPPAGSSLPGVGEREQRAGKDVERPVLPEPALKASMYFKYGNDRREGFKSETTFDAILAGERTSTTRYKELGPTERWERLPRGSVVRFYEDKEMRGRSVDVVVLGTERIRLRDLDAKGLDEWSKVEGWSVEHGRDSARKFSEGVQIRYALPESPEGRAALGLEVPQGQAPARDAGRDVRPLTPEGQAWGARPSAAAMGAMTDKDRALSLF